MDNSACIVMTSIGTEDEAERLAAAIVEARLAACVQVQRVRSLYVWQGELHREPEWALQIKTLRARYAALEPSSANDTATKRRRSCKCRSRMARLTT